MHSEPLSPEHRTALLRLVEALRTAADASTTFEAPVAEVAELADRAEALARDLHARRGARPLPRFAPFDPAEPGAMLPFSPVSGAFNPMAPPFAMRVEGDSPRKLVAHVRFGAAFEGPPSSVHGGVVSAAWDQLLALGNMANETGGPTASLTVRYRAPTPLHEELRFEAWTDRVDGRKIWAHGRCYAGDRLVTEAEGLFVALDPAQAAKVWARGTSRGG